MSTSHERSSALPSGRIARRTPVDERHPRLRAREDVRDAPARAGLERLGGERVLEPRCRHARRPARRARGASRARPVSPASARSRADDVHERVADERVELDAARSAPSRAGGATRGGGRGGRRRSRRRGRAARRVPAPRRARARGRSRPSRPGARRTRAPAASAAASAPARDRVEVADDDVDLEPERERAVETAVGGDHGRRRGQLDDGARPRGDDDDVRLVHAFLRWHYPGQVLRVGGASAALSARSPELPGSLRGILDHPRYVTLKPRSPTGARSSTSSGVDPRLGRPAAEPRDEHLDVLGVALELGLDRPVGAVAHPARRRRAPRHVGARSP